MYADMKRLSRNRPALSRLAATWQFRPGREAMLSQDAAAADVLAHLRAIHSTEFIK